MAQQYGNTTNICRLHGDVVQVVELAEHAHLRELRLSLLGFDDSEFADLLADDEASEPLTDPDEIPEPEETPVSRTGDIWTLGNHRLMCGDSMTIFHAENRAAIFAAAGSGNHAAPIPREPLRTIADSQDREAGRYAAEVGLGSILGTDARRASG